MYDWIKIGCDCRSEECTIYSLGKIGSCVYGHDIDNKKNKKTLLPAVLNQYWEYDIAQHITCVT